MPHRSCQESTPLESSERELLKFGLIEFLPEHLSPDIMGLVSIHKDLQSDYSINKGK